MKRIRPSTIFIVLILASWVVFFYYISVNTIFANTVLPNIKIDKQDFSLLSEADAKNKISQLVIQSLPQTINVQVDGYNVSMPVTDLNIKVDADKVLKYGKGPNIIQSFIEGLSLFRGKQVEVDYDFDTTAFVKNIPIDLSSTNPSYVDSNNYAHCIPNEYKINLDETKIKDVILKALNSNGNTNSQLQNIFSDPSDITLVDACNNYQNDLQQLQTALQKIDPQNKYSADSMFGIKITSFNHRWEVRDWNSFEQALKDYAAKTNTSPDEGESELMGDKVFLFKMYTNGKSLNISNTEAQMANWFKSPTTDLPLAYDDTPPKILNTSLPIFDFTQLVSSGKTRIDLIRHGVPNFVVPYTVYGLDEIQNTIIEPHKEFSYIDTIDPQPNGLTKSGRPIAGGICNSTTTIFRAALQGGFPITDRSSHEWYVPSYEWGDYPYNIVDAAYYTDPKVDFKFVNDTDYPILLRVSYSKDADYQYNTVNIFTSSKAPKRTVDLSNWKIWDQYSTYSFKGSFDRTVKQDGNVVRQDNFFSQYFGLLPGA